MLSFLRTTGVAIFFQPLIAPHGVTAGSHISLMTFLSKRSRFWVVWTAHPTSRVSGLVDISKLPMVVRLAELVIFVRALVHNSIRF